MYGTLIPPAKPVSGITVTVPSVAIATVPFGNSIDCSVPGTTGTLLISEIVNGSASGSVSFANRSIMTGVFGSVVTVSSIASGVGLTGCIVTLGVIVPPLLSVALNGMTVSLLLSTGGINVNSLVSGSNVAPVGNSTGIIVSGSPLTSVR